MLNRRTFLGATAVAPFILSSRAFGANEKIAIGLVGAGARGVAVMNGFLKIPEVRITAVCDVDDFHYREHTSRTGRPLGRMPAKASVDAHYKDESCAVYSDFRELCARDDLDAVIVATPDHWHALASLEAIHSGKDVYCEKPITHTFAEGRALHQAVAKHKAIFQTGSQQRSGKEFHRAVTLVRNGVLGKIQRVEVGLSAGYADAQGSITEEKPPAQLDYDMWCGPSPMLPYMRARHHRWWRGHTAFGGGTLMDWIGHHNDIASWGMDMDSRGPLSVEAFGWTKSNSEVYDTPVDYEIRCEYPDEIKWTISSKLKAGAHWVGENGAWIHVNRGKLEASNPEWLDPEFDHGGSFAIASTGTLHDQNFIDGIKSRKTCIAPAETAHRSVTPGHLGYLSHQLGRKIKWDSQNEKVVGDDEAQKILEQVDYRNGWEL